MKKSFLNMLLFTALLVLLALFTSCNHKADPDKTIRVSIIEHESCEISDNGRDVQPGDNAEFKLRVLNGELTRVDYNGEYSIRKESGFTYLTLFSVRFPQRIRLFITSSFRTVTYYENGGSRTQACYEVFGDGAVSLTSDTRIHSRPNTLQGTRWFVRDGYTLECWNTEPDGSGMRVGLGSRVTAAPEGLTLYAVWKRWTEPGFFSYNIIDGAEDDPYPNAIEITGCSFSGAELTVPAFISGIPVRAICQNAFSACPAESVILPETLSRVDENAFLDSKMSRLTLFDNLAEFSDASFAGCADLTTLCINAVEAPYGYLYRRESCYADKLDLLINAAGKRKLVFYGGCSVWYNLDGDIAKRDLGEDFTLVNIGVNGTVSSLVQMEIMRPYLENGDILFHTPEVSSSPQLMTHTAMTKEDIKLWSGIEYNYDLFTNVDMRKVSGVFDSLCLYLGRKEKEGSYNDVYRDSDGRIYLDDIGCIPFERTETKDELPDNVKLDIDKLSDADLTVLSEQYRLIKEMGVTVIVSCACVNIDVVPDEQKGNIDKVDAWLRERLSEMGVDYISSLRDYIYHTVSYYDTNYHLLTDAARYNTSLWVRDIKAWLEGRDRA